MGFLRGRLMVCGLFLTVAGAMATWSSVSHQTGGVEATATVLGHISECQVEYQLVSESRRTERPMDCDAATLFQNSLGSQKVKLYRTDLVRLRYVSRDGRPHEARVAEASVLAHEAKVGAQLPVVYDPGHPDDVRAPLTMGLLGFAVGMLVVGVFLVLLGLGPGVLARAFAGRPKVSFAGVEPDGDGSDAAMVARLREAVAAASETKGSKAEIQSTFSGSSAPTFGKRRSAA